MSGLPGTVAPYTPYPNPVEVPGAGSADTPLVCVQFSAAWLPYVIGCVKALACDSTWASADPSMVASTVSAANNLLGLLQETDCPMITFRVNPVNPYLIDASIDGGITWVTMPDTEPDAIVQHPTTARSNQISAPAGVIGLNILATDKTGIGVNQAGDAFAADLYQSSPTSTKAPLQLSRVTANGAMLHLANAARGSEHDAISWDYAYLAPQSSPLPTADYAHRGAIMLDGSGAPYFCLETTSGIFSWIAIAGGAVSSGTIIDGVDVTTLSPGSSATAAFISTGVTGHVRLALGVPAGATGATGAMGATGATGATGSAGSPCDCIPTQSPPTVSSGQSVGCILAANATAALKESIGHALTTATGGGNALTVGSAFASILAIFAAGAVEVGTAGLATPAILGLAGAVISGLSSGASGDLNDAAYAKLQCILYCNVNGTSHLFDDVAITAIHTAIDAETTFAAEVKPIFDKAIDSFGARGLNSAGIGGLIGSADCSGCGCGGTWSETLEIQATGGVVSTTHMTDTSKSYRVDFSGTWIIGSFGSPGSIHGDAIWREGSGPDDWSAYDVNININGTQIPSQAYNSAHTYTMTISGTGAAFTFQCNDTFTGDNSGQIQVMITEL